VTVNKPLDSEHLASGYVIVDEDWVVTACNRKASLILDRTKTDMIGKHCREIFSDDLRFKDICTHLHPLSKQKNSQNRELTLSNPISGEKHAIRLSIITIPGKKSGIMGAIIGFADLTEPLAASRLALNSIAEGVFTVDQNWQLTSFNKAAETITGWTEEQVLGNLAKKYLKQISVTPIVQSLIVFAQNLQLPAALLF